MIAAIENAMVSRLKAASEAGILGYKFQTLTTYPEDWDEYLKDKAWRCPAAWAVFAGWSGAEALAAGTRVTGSFGLVVAAENLRPDEQAQRHGGPIAAEVGSYRLMLDAARLLSGSDLDLDIGGLVLGDCRSVRPTVAIKERKVSMFALEFTTTFVVPAAGSADLADLDDFAAFHANYAVPPHAADADPGQPGAQIPADGQADATDHLILETL